MKPQGSASRKKALSWRSRHGPAQPRIAAPDTDADTDADIDSLDADSLLVQVGDFNDRDAAREAWDQLEEAFAGAMSGKQRVIQEVGTASNPYRLRVAGFDDYSAAEAFCSQVQGESQGCIPVRAQ